MCYQVVPQITAQTATLAIARAFGDGLDSGAEEERVKANSRWIGPRDGRGDVAKQPRYIYKQP